MRILLAFGLDSIWLLDLDLALELELELDLDLDLDSGAILVGFGLICFGFWSIRALIALVALLGGPGRSWEVLGGPRNA